MKYFSSKARWAKTFSIICLLGMLFSACSHKSNYSNIPAITYNSFTCFCDAAKPTQSDSAYLRVNFTDGDGDIGYPTSDASAPNDFFVIPTIDSSGIFTPLIVNDTILTFKYHIPYITPSGTDKSLNGIIQINLENLVQQISGLTIPNHNTHIFQFQVWIMDRAGNKSNILTSPTVHSCGG